MPRPSSPLDAKASTRCPSFTSLPSPRPSRKISTPRSLATSRGPRPRIAQRSAREEPDLAAEAGQHTHAVEHAHTMHLVTRRQRSSSTGACPRSLARHSPCHHNDPTSPPPRGLSGCPTIAVFAGLWPAGRGPREVARLRGVSWWARADSNGRPHPYQGCALTS